MPRRFGRARPRSAGDNTWAMPWANGRHSGKMMADPVSVVADGERRRSRRRRRDRDKVGRLRKDKQRNLVTLFVKLPGSSRMRPAPIRRSQPAGMGPGAALAPRRGRDLRAPPEGNQYPRSEPHPRAYRTRWADRHVIEMFRQNRRRRVQTEEPRPSIGESGRMLCMGAQGLRRRAFVDDMGHPRDGSMSKEKLDRKVASQRFLHP